MIFNSKKFFLLGTLLSVSGFMGCSSEDKVLSTEYNVSEIKNGKLVDSRDGKEYNVAYIAGYYWMAENLRYADTNITEALKGNTWCYENDKKECEKLGRLYSWNAAIEACPVGWELPTNQNWKQLLSYINEYNGNEESGTSLKSLESWDNDVASPTNRFGFNALAAGRRNNDGETFMSKGKYTYFWSSNYKDEGTAYGWSLLNDADILQDGFYYKDHGLSVRCIAREGSIKVSGSLDSSYIEKIPHNYGSLKYKNETYRTVKIGGNEWMADNLNYEVEGSHCYNDEKEKCNEFGRLYSFEAAQKVCPDGWHLPTSMDIQNLLIDQSSRDLRSRSGWTDKTAKGLNFWGFDAKAAGGKSNGDYFDLKMSAYFWVDEKVGNDATVFWISCYENSPTEVKRNATNEFSVRCVKDK